MNWTPEDLEMIDRVVKNAVRTEFARNPHRCNFNFTQEEAQTIKNYTRRGRMIERIVMYTLATCAMAMLIDRIFPGWNLPTVG